MDKQRLREMITPIKPALRAVRDTKLVTWGISKAKSLSRKRLHGMARSLDGFEDAGISDADRARLKKMAWHFVHNPDTFDVLCQSMTEQWSVGSGAKVVHALKHFSGSPIPYGFEDMPHAVMTSIHNTYAPWLTDKKLQKFYDNVAAAYVNEDLLTRYMGPQKPPLGKEYSLLDMYRFWTIWQTMLNLRHIDGNTVEVGVWRGATSALICHAMETTNQKGTHYACDTFEGVVKAGAKDTAYVGGEHSDTGVEVVEEIVGRFAPSSRFKILKGIFPEDTIDQFPKDEPIKFIHIDVDVYQSAKDCVDVLWPSMVPHGVMIFDDYALQGTEGMATLAHELIADRNDMMFYHMFNGQGMFVKLADPA